MKFDGTNWLNVGNPGFSADAAQFTSLAFNPSGEPYVAYTDFGSAWKVTVMKYDSVYVGINNMQGSIFSLYPNPATDRIILETSTEAIKGELVILNLEGQKLITRQLTAPKTQIEISNLPKGFYFVRLTNDKTVTVEKIIKQ